MECIENREKFVRNLYEHLATNGILIVSHHDFDSAIYNSNFVAFTRQLIHFFSDQGESWQNYCDGQIGRKIPGIFKKAQIDHVEFQTWRLLKPVLKKMIMAI